MVTYAYLSVINAFLRRHMHKGISVWLDVPLEALAKRITAEGTKSRPLLHEESGDIYDKVVFPSNRQLEYPILIYMSRTIADMLCSSC